MSDAVRPVTAMVLAAGMGTRMRPLTDTRPKPLVELTGRALIDHVLDRLVAAGVTRAVVNVHYFADSLEIHLAARGNPEIIISDERGVLLDTGGGVMRARADLGGGPFFIHNSDSVWIEHGRPALGDLLDAWNSDKMDSLLLLARRAGSLGYEARGDFNLEKDERLVRRAPGAEAPYVFAGVSIAHPRLFDGAPSGAFSLNELWDRAIGQGRLYGVVLDGQWMHVGTAAALFEAEALLAKAAAPGASGGGAE